MKTTFTILSLLCCLFIATTTEVQAQIKKRKYTPLKEFSNDTLAFLKKNFDYACSEDYYAAYHFDREMKTFKEEISKDLPIKAFRIIKNSDDPRYRALYIIEFYYYSPQQIIEKDKKGIPVYDIQMYLHIWKDNPLYQEMQEAGINLEEELMAWDDKYWDVICKLPIAPFYVSKYYKNTAEIPDKGDFFIIDDSEIDDIYSDSE